MLGNSMNKSTEIYTYFPSQQIDAAAKDKKMKKNLAGLGYEL